MANSKPQLKAYEIYAKEFEDVKVVINHYNIGSAKYKFYLLITDSYPTIKITSIKAKLIGEPVNSEALHNLKKYYKANNFDAGKRVLIEGKQGVITGSRSSYFNVILDENRKFEHVVHLNDIKLIE